jgi:hypothetical protein
MSRKELQSQLDNLMALLSSNPDAARSKVSNMGVEALEEMLQQDAELEQLREQLDRDVLERMERTGESFEDATKKVEKSYRKGRGRIAKADIRARKKGARDFRINPLMSQAELEEGVRQDLEFGESAGKLKRADTPQELKRAQLERGYESSGLTSEKPIGKTALDLNRKNEVRRFFSLEEEAPKSKRTGTTRVYEPPEDPEAFLEYKRAQSRVMKSSDSYKSGENFRIMKKGNRTFLMLKGPAVVGGKQFNEPRQIFQVVNGEVVQETVLDKRQANELLKALNESGFKVSKERIQVKSPKQFKQKAKKKATTKKTQASKNRSLKMLRKLPSGKVEALMALLLAIPTLGTAAGVAASAGDQDAS